jgi:Fe-Mn family superoxide dismutase
MTSTTSNDMTRREVLTTVALGGAALLGSCTSAAPASAEPPRSKDPRTKTTGAPTTMSTTAALTGKNEVVALPFAAGSLNGLSERLITSHHENNYGGAVKNLNRVELELARINSDTPPFVVAALRERELTFRNSKNLHEAYFGNLGGNGKRSGAIEGALASAYETSGRWEQQMRATGLGLGGGSGWAILGLELDTGALRTVWSGNHTQVLATSVPLLVMDMYEHSYHIDFGAAVARYIDAFFANVSWEEVNRRFERAQRASAVFRGVGT